MNKELTLEEIHEELLCQLRDITAVCSRHGIQYNLMCGTLLGSVRHKGFIPWDDDVDLLFTREEFNRFRKVYPQECDRQFELTYLDTWTPRVMNRDPEKAAAFTDFFILDPPAAGGLAAEAASAPAAPSAGHDEEKCGLQPLRPEKQNSAAGHPSDRAAFFLCVEGAAV